MAYKWTKRIGELILERTSNDEEESKKVAMWYRHIDSTTKVTPIYKCGDIYGLFNNYNYLLIWKEENDYSSVYKNVRRS